MPVNSQFQLFPSRPGDPLSTLSLWVCLSWIFFYIYILCKQTQTNVDFCVWLLSLGVMLSRFIYVVAYKVLLSFLNNILVYYCTTFCLFIHHLIKHLDYFNFLAIMNNAAVNICVQFFVCTYAILLGRITSRIPLRSGVTGSYGNSIFGFGRTVKLFFPWSLYYFKLPSEMVIYLFFIFNLCLL